MLSKQLQAAINAQINAEYWSAYLYLSMSLDAQSQGLNGVANWFYVQWQEEQDHARIFEQYLLSQDAIVKLQPIESVPVSWQDVRQMFSETLQHEQDVTAMIVDLVKRAQQDEDFASLNRLQWFIDEQVEEEKAARDMLTYLDLFGEEPLPLYNLDAVLAQRTYRVADPLVHG